ncbi:hypothetical protein Tco_1243433 [Tanacetum coccineum]
MAQPQRPTDAHQDELCLKNKRYALIDANKKVDLENLLFPDESRILADILKNHPLRFSIAASSSVPWIYLGKFWHTLHEDGSNYTLKFMLDRKELTLTLDDFRTIIYLPQATDNNHDYFVPAPTFSKMVPFYIINLGFTLELRSTYNFKTTGLLQPWQTLCKIITLGRISLLFKESNNNDSLSKIHKADRKSKGIVGMKILDWMITNEMKLTENYRLYAEVFGIDVPTTQSQPIESTQGTHMTTSTPRSPNAVVTKGESSAPRMSTVIRLHTLQVSMAEQKSHEELETTQNVEKVKEQLIAEEIEKLVEGSKNVEENDEESPEVEKNADISQPVNVIDEEEESAKDDYELRRREKRKYVEEIRNTPSPTTIRSPRIQTNLISLDTEKLQELMKTDPQPSSSTPSSSSPKSKLSTTN